jgi:hypothetical protein
MQCDVDYDTPSTLDPLTPPGTLKDYSRSLKARHTLGMAAAMKLLPIDRVPRSRSMYDLDDNPFDRLYSLSPTGLPRSDTFGSLDAHLEQDNDKDEGRMLSHTPAAGEAPWRPSLIQFARKESSTSTPGSFSSEASFEGGSAADHLRVYGDHRPASVTTPADVRDSGMEDDSPFSLSAYLQPSPAVSGNSYSYSPDMPGPAPNHNRMSVASTMTTSSTISTDTYRSTASNATVTITSAQVAKVKRPSMLRPRPRAHDYHPYDHERNRMYDDDPAYMPSFDNHQVSGQGSLDVDVNMAVPAADARGMSFSTEKREMVADGRSMSEVMVAMAGLRCQRGRNRYRAKQ